jgi:hypothetical protein
MLDEQAYTQWSRTQEKAQVAMSWVQYPCNGAEAGSSADRKDRSKALREHQLDYYDIFSLI